MFKFQLCCPSPAIGDEKIVLKCQEEVVGGPGHMLMQSCVS